MEPNGILIYGEINEDNIIIVCNGGLLKVTDYENVDNVKLIVGHKFK